MTAEVLQYDLERSKIECLSHISFVVDGEDYYDFVAYSRCGAVNHGPPPRAAPYDLVYGPVSLWPQHLVIANCDQILFSDPRAVRGFDNPTRSVSPPDARRFRTSAMPQVEAKTLDHSVAMKGYFTDVARRLVRDHDKSPEEARDLIDRYFSIDVDPLERAFIMHTDAEVVAADLAGRSTGGI